jgi:hypothetical protein
MDEAPDAAGAGGLSTDATVPPSGTVTGAVSRAVAPRAAVSATVEVSTAADAGEGEGDALVALRTSAIACAVRSSFCGVGCSGGAARSRTARSIFFRPLPEIQKKTPTPMSASIAKNRKPRLRLRRLPPAAFGLLAPGD